MKVPRWTPATPTAIAARRTWVKAMVAASPDLPADLPTYGSPHWAALADDDPRKLAAAVIAAECWATDRDELPGRLRDEIADLHAAFNAARDGYWAELFAEAVNVAHAAATPAAFAMRRHYATPQAQRIANARRARPGDRPPAEQHRHAVQDGEAA
ncbi:DUF2742 domain-containing protein [Kribbella sp. NPDC020789]